MKKISVVVLTVLLTLMTACTQYVFVPGDIFPGFGGDNSISQQDRTDAIAMMNYLQSDSFLTKVKDGDSGLTITRTVQSAVSSGTRMRSVMNQKSVGSSFLATITFNPSFVDNEAGVSITSGTIEMEFNTVQTRNDTYAITAADVSVTNTLSYSVNGNSGTFSMSYTGGPASGTISTSTGDSSFSFSSEITISASGNISITINTSTITQLPEDMGSQITNGFGGGTGTEQDPYLIYNEEQFSNIKTLVPAMANDPEGFFYFSVMNDLEFTDAMDSPAIGIFRGNIDFNNHSLSGLSFALINNNLSDLQREYMVYDAAYGLIDNFLEGTISNLEYRPDGLVMFAFMTHYYNSVLYNNGVQNSTQTVTFRNVDAYGDFNEPDNNNTSCYISQAFQGYTIFEDCTNYASQVTAYGSAFVGGYPWGQFNDGSYSYVTFENCVNYGDITGERAAVFIGSHNTISRLSNVTEPIIKVINCANYGTIQGSYGVGYYFPTANGKANPADYKWFDMSTDSTNTGNDAGHIILLINPTNVTVTANEDGAFSIANSNASYSSFMIQGSTYSTTTNPDGTIRIYVSQEDIACASGSTVISDIKKLQIIDSTNPSIDNTALSTVRTDAYGNQLITVGNVDYYYNDSSTIGGVVGGSALVADLTWTLTCYDADGFIVGQMDIE